MIEILMFSLPERCWVSLSAAMFLLLRAFLINLPWPDRIRSGVKGLGTMFCQHWNSGWHSWSNWRFVNFFDHDWSLKACSKIKIVQRKFHQTSHACFFPQFWNPSLNRLYMSAIWLKFYLLWRRSLYLSFHKICFIWSFSYLSDFEL